MSTRDDDVPDVQALTKEIAKTGADPFWVSECVAIEQEAIAAAKAGSPTPPEPARWMKPSAADGDAPPSNAELETRLALAEARVRALEDMLAEVRQVLADWKALALREE
jgi:hypothetical protein